MKRALCFVVVTIGLVVACNNEQVAPLSPDACEQLANDAAQAYSSGVVPYQQPCNADTDCELLPLNLSCADDGAAAIAISFEAAAIALAQKINGDQCARFTASGCTPQLPHNPASDTPDVVVCSNHVCQVRTLNLRVDGARTGDGTTCTWGPADAGAPSYAIGDAVLAPSGCQDCVCAQAGIICVGICNP